MRNHARVEANATAKVTAGGRGERAAKIRRVRCFATIIVGDTPGHSDAWSYLLMINWSHTPTMAECWRARPQTHSHTTIYVIRGYFGPSEQSPRRRRRRRCSDLTHQRQAHQTMGLSVETGQVSVSVCILVQVHPFKSLAGETARDLTSKIRRLRPSSFWPTEMAQNRVHSREAQTGLRC